MLVDMIKDGGDDKLQTVVEFVADATSSVRQVCWHPDESNESLVARLTNKAIDVLRIGENNNEPSFRRVIVDAELAEQVQWNPHKLSELAYTHAKSIVGVDTRQSGSQAAWRIDDADTLRLKTFDFNVRKENSIFFSLEKSVCF